MKIPPKVVALIFPPHEQYCSDVIDGIIATMEGRNTWQMIDLPRKRVGHSPLPRGGLRLDGALVWSDAPFDQWLADLAATGVRVVNCGSGWVGHPQISNITVDRAAFLKPINEHFRSLGLKHLIAVDYQLPKNPGTREWMESIIANAATYGMSGRVFDIGGGTNPAEESRRIHEPDREKPLLDLLRNLPPSCGVICGNDSIGALVSNVACLLGLRVPEDVAIACFGNNLVARIATPPITSIAPDGRQIGRAACQLLARHLDGEARGAENIQLGGEIYVLHIRESTAGPSMKVEMERARRFIDNEALAGVSMKDLVRITGLSINTLNSNYVQAFGISPAKAIQARRIGEAKRLLRETALPITEIACRCGFNSASGFYNYFTRHAGVIPSVWREGGEPAAP